MKKEINACVMLFNNERGTFDFLTEIELPAIPNKGDKIILDDDEGIGQVYEVYDVHLQQPALISM